MLQYFKDQNIIRKAKLAHKLYLALQLKGLDEKDKKLKILFWFNSLSDEESKKYKYILNHFINYDDLISEK